MWLTWKGDSKAQRENFTLQKKNMNMLTERESRWWRELTRESGSVCKIENTQ